MIVNPAVKAILSTATDVSIICEVYDPDAVPGVDGLDPSAAIECFAAVSGITYRTRNYKQLVSRFGSIKRTITSEVNSASVEFSNVSREIAQFEFETGFEGLILVIRMISRSQSILLTDSQILFTGRCEKPKSGNKSSLSVSAKFILGSLDVKVPRRKFGPTDQEGRPPSDPKFEGFRFMPQYGTSFYSVRTRRRGIAGWFGFKKTSLKTMPWSSFSDIDANKSVPEVFGRSQIIGTHLGYADVGTAIRLRTAFCEGEISAIFNARSLDPYFPLSATSYAAVMGLVGSLNGPDDPSWVAPGFYSRTAHFRGQADNSAVDVTDPAPEIAAVIVGRLMTIPNPATGVWENYGWTNNAAAHTYFLLTSPDYHKLHENWIDKASALEVFNYNAERIFDISLSDFILLSEA